METIKIEPSDKSQGKYVLINADDYDPKQHKKYGEKQAAKPKAKAKG